MELTDTMREYAAAKMEKLPRYYDRIQAIEVVLDKVNQGFEVEVLVTAEHAEPFVAKVSGLDLYACIDESTDKLERQLTDHKDKLRNRKHNVTR